MLLIKGISVKPSPPHESVVIYIGNLSQNVNEAHLKEIFSNFGEMVNVELSMDRVVSPPPMVVVAPNRRELSMRENTTPNTIKDGVVHRNESPPPRRKSRSPQRRSPINKRGDSPPRRRGDSPPHPRLVSPPCRHSSPAFRHRNRSPIRTSPRRVRESLAGHQCSPLSHRRQ